MKNGQNSGECPDALRVPWDEHKNGLLLRVRVTPRGGRDAVDGIGLLSDGRSVLKVRVRAAPQDGEANDSVRRLLAKSLKLPVSFIKFDAGETARIKAFVIEGDGDILRTKLAEMLQI